MTGQQTIKSISAKGLFEVLQSHDQPVIINALDEDAYFAKHISGSVNISVDNADWIEDILPDKNQDIVVYCANAQCPDSPNLAKALMEKGYTQVPDFEEGSAGWSEAGYKLVGNNVN